jgi:hypothetical protein
MFAGLQAPQQLDLDVPQFLYGVVVASAQVLEDASEDAFVEFVIKPQSRQMASVHCSARSPVLRRMQSYCLPQCLKHIEAVAQRQFDQGCITRTIDVDVERAHLTRVQYACLTESQYNNELWQGVLTEDPCDDNSNESIIVERLQLQAEVHTFERLQRWQETESVTEITDLQQRNVYVARFSSLVATPDELDWRLVFFAVRTRGTPHVLSTNIVPTPAME